MDDTQRVGERCLSRSAAYWNFATLGEEREYLPTSRKHGREYKVQHDAFYIKPNKACSKSNIKTQMAELVKKAAYWKD
jgi:hypothetical protein